MRLRIAPTRTLLIFPTLIWLAGCAGANEDNPVVAEVEASLSSMTRDTATLVRRPGPDLFFEAHSDSTGYRRIRVTESGTLSRASATAYYDDLTRARFVEAQAVGVNTGGLMTGEEIEELAAMVFGASN